MLSRRTLLRNLASTALAVNSFSFLSGAIASEETLTFRKNSPVLKLNFNENAGGMSPKAIAAAENYLRKEHNRYPDAAMNALRQAVAAHHDVKEEQVMLGSGSTEILQLTVLAAAQDGATIIDATPTYGQISRDAKRHCLKVIAVPVQHNFKTDLDAMKAAAAQISGPALINLCNPNNPTGTIIPAKELADWISEAPEQHTFLLDEAYFDYANAETKGYGSMLPLVKAGRENLIIARTFSKVHGMAGLRVGYGIAGAATARRVSAFSNGINLNGVGATAALAALQDTQFYQQSLKTNAKAKNHLVSSLEALGLQTIPSSTNFVLHRIGSPVADYQRRMRANNILVGRRMTTEDGWNRLSLGTPEEMVHFTQTLTAFREQGWV